jgi:hypothetical protein
MLISSSAEDGTRAVCKFIQAFLLPRRKREKKKTKKKKNEWMNERRKERDVLSTSEEENNECNSKSNSPRGPATANPHPRAISEKKSCVEVIPRQRTKAIQLTLPSSSSSLQDPVLPGPVLSCLSCIFRLHRCLHLAHRPRSDPCFEAFLTAQSVTSRPMKHLKTC